MNKKKLCLALAVIPVVLSAVQARAEDGLELYGVLDVGIGSLEHSYSGSGLFASTVNPYNLNSSPSSFTGLYTGGISMSRWGIRGSEDMGGGMKAFFRLEGALNASDGAVANNGQSIYNNVNGLTAANGASAINGQLFSRAAYIGLSDSNLGSVQAGRTTNFSFDQVVEYDPVQGALLFSPIGFSGGIGGGLGATENTRLDNSLKYENKVGDVGFGLQYKFKGSSSDASAGSAVVAMLGYLNGPLSLKATYAKTTNTVAYATQYSNVVAPDNNLQIENTSGFMVTGKYQITFEATIKAGYEYTTISAPSNMNLTGITNYYGIILGNPAVNASGLQHFATAWIGGDYKFTKAFDLGVGYYNIDTTNNPVINKQYDNNTLSILADYNLSKRSDIYAGAMLSHYSGIALVKHAPTDAYSSNAMYGVGLRVRF